MKDEKVNPLFAELFRPCCSRTIVHRKAAGWRLLLLTYKPGAVEEADRAGEGAHGREVRPGGAASRVTLNLPRARNPRWELEPGMGMIPDPRQIGGGTPTPDPRQIGDGDGDGDQGPRALNLPTARETTRDDAPTGGRPPGQGIIAHYRGENGRKFDVTNKQSGTN